MIGRTQDQRYRAKQAKTNLIIIAVTAAVFAAGVVTGRISKTTVAELPEAPTDSAEDFVGASPSDPTEASICFIESTDSRSDDAKEVTQPTEPKISPYYPLTDEDRDIISRVVMAEAGGEDYNGQRLVAQCILNACLFDGISPDEAIERYQYTSVRPEPTESVMEAVSAVFDLHDVVTDEPILYFYAPALCSSEWHESQVFVLEHGGHRFFAEWEG